MSLAGPGQAWVLSLQIDKIKKLFSQIIMFRFRQVDRPQTRFHSCVCDDKMVLLLVLRSICLKYTADFDFRTTGSQSGFGSGQCLFLIPEYGAGQSFQP